MDTKLFCGKEKSKAVIHIQRKSEVDDSVDNNVEDVAGHAGYIDDDDDDDEPHDIQMLELCDTDIACSYRRQNTAHVYPWSKSRYSE